MSESVSTISKIISTLVSPKVYLKYIFVALALVISWRYFSNQDLMSVVGPEHKGIVLLLLSLGFGSLFADIVYYLFNVLRNKSLCKIQKQKAKAEKDLEIETLIKTFELTYYHLSDGQVNFLERLLDDTGTMYLNSDEHKTLLENHYVIDIQKVTANEVVVALNPFIKDHIIKQRNQLTESMVEDFLGSGLENAEILLKHLENPENPKKEKINLSYLNDITKSPICIEAEISEKQDGFHVWFSDRRFEEYFKIKNNKEYNFETFVNKSYIIY
jgi:hypothetical protein